LCVVCLSVREMGFPNRLRVGSLLQTLAAMRLCHKTVVYSVRSAGRVYGATSPVQWDM
jgi:hypothetical protein